jgi:hypothetical protein
VKDEIPEQQPKRSPMEPHPEQDDQPEDGTGGRGGVIAAVVIGAIFLILVALHLAGGMSLHGS